MSRAKRFFNATGQFLGQWDSQGTANGQFKSPSGIAIKANGEVLVADGSREQRFNAYGGYLGTLGSQGDGQSTYPRAVAVAPNGDVFVTDREARVQRFTASGAFLGAWDTLGSGQGQLIGHNGKDVYVADSTNNRIQQFALPVPVTPSKKRKKKKKRKERLARP